VSKNLDLISAELDFIIGVWAKLPEDFKEEMVEAIMRVLDKDKHKKEAVRPTYLWADPRGQPFSIQVAPMSEPDFCPKGPAHRRRPIGCKIERSRPGGNKSSIANDWLQS
jgi:hypothetical protein